MLKQTVQYLSDRATFTVLPVRHRRRRSHQLAVELRRAKHGDVEAIAPGIFGQEAALKKLAPPSKGTEVEDPDTVVVAGTQAFGDFERTAA